MGRVGDKPKVAIKVILAGGITGAGTGLSFMLAHDLLTTDQMFDGWEFGLAVAIPGLIALLIGRVANSGHYTFLPVAYLTLAIPVLGPAFGGTGNEPSWLFGVLGLVGGLVWSIPFAIWKMR
ncbi:MAG: hypothetical protein FI680_01600 [SAR202 cluster bacterium]|nr:hypothetical protein [SAR202 cluster bacterium]|tara:strand:- start:198 stop:563 length:366 start_codon:yes stop_codon:yes gene_type:complete